MASVIDRSSPDNICILCEVGIQNLVCGYILGLLSVAYCFWVILTLASGLAYRKIEKKVCLEMSNNFQQMSCIRHATVKYPVYYRL